MEQVGIDAERGLAALVLRDLDLVRLGKGQQGLAGLKVPFAPRGDHVNIRLKGIVAQLETDLIIALAGRAVADRISPNLAGDLDLFLGDQGARDRGAEQILPLIDRIGAEHGEHIIAHELFAHILDEDVLWLDASGQSLGPRRFDLFALAEVGGEGHDLCAIFGLKPLQNDRGVQAATIGEHDFFHGAFGVGHDGRS